MSTPMVHAASEFATSYTSLYVINQAGESQITHTISLKNNLAHIYATEYSFVISGDHPTRLLVSDEIGPIPTDLSVQNNQTTIHLIITRPAIGKDQSKTLTITYQTDDLVELIGDTMTINIPRLAKGNETDNYTRIVEVENNKELPSLIFPQPNITTTKSPYTSYTFIGHANDALTLLFGKSVTYKLNLKYQLKNKELNSIDSELALPPDTPYQQVILSQIFPPPLNVRIDQDGNWLARYTLKPQEKLLVEAEVYATIYPQPVLADPSSHDPFTLNHKDYWDTESEIVVELAKQLKNPLNIYTYLTGNFTYNYEKGALGTSRLGATKALTSPTQVVCTEFTDTFVALARVLRIPAREINGYAYTTNALLKPLNLATDVLHAWPEYYDGPRDTWLQVDPTWGNTTGGVDYYNKLDFSHITFVRHGLEPTYPLPAGVYKDSPDQKFVGVEVTATPPQIVSQTKQVDNQIINTGNVGIWHELVGYLPPYGSAAIITPPHLSLYDKIKLLCASLLSKFSQLLPASI